MRKSFAFLLLPLLVATVSAAFAQDAALIEAARKEGKVVWHTSLALPSSTAISHYFQNKYKGIEVEVHRNGSQRVLQRFMQETAAGIKNADIVHTSDAGHFELLKDKNLLLKFTPQGVASFPDGFKDKAGFYYGMRATLSVIAHNPKIVSEKDAPQTWKDLIESQMERQTGHGPSRLQRHHHDPCAGARECLWLGVFPRSGEKQTAPGAVGQRSGWRRRFGRAAGGRKRRRILLLQNLEAGKSDQDRLSQRGCPLGRLTRWPSPKTRHTPTRRSFLRSLFLRKSRSSYWPTKRDSTPVILK